MNLHFEASHEEGQSKMVTVYIDGSCIGNGGPSAKGRYGVFSMTVILGMGVLQYLLKRDQPTTMPN